MRPLTLLALVVSGVLPAVSHAATTPPAAVLDVGLGTPVLQIAKLRKRVEADPADPQLIRTVHGSGYRFDG